MPRYLERMTLPFKQVDYGAHGLRHGDRIQFRLSDEGPLLVGTVRDELGQLERSAAVAVDLANGASCVIDGLKTEWAQATPEAEAAYLALAADWAREEQERYESRPLLDEVARQALRSDVLTADETKMIVERLIRRYGEADYFESKGAVEMSLLAEVAPKLEEMSLEQIGVLVLDLSELPEMEEAARTLLSQLDERDDFDDVFVDRRLLALY